MNHKWHTRYTAWHKNDLMTKDNQLLTPPKNIGYNLCSRGHAPTQHTWKASASCKVNRCVEVHIQADIQTEPLTRVSVEIIGKHKKKQLEAKDVSVMKNRLQLRGKRRKSVDESLSKTGQKPTEAYYKLLLQMSAEECEAGNMMYSQMPKLMKQATWELQQARCLQLSVVNKLGCLSIQRIRTSHGGFPNSTVGNSCTFLHTGHWHGHISLATLPTRAGGCLHRGLSNRKWRSDSRWCNRVCNSEEYVSELVTDFSLFNRAFTFTC